MSKCKGPEVSIDLKWNITVRCIYSTITGKDTCAELTIADHSKKLVWSKCGIMATGSEHRYLIQSEVMHRSWLSDIGFIKVEESVRTYGEVRTSKSVEKTVPRPVDHIICS